MSSKPGVFALSKQASEFVFPNMKLFFQHAKIVLPLLLAIDLGGRFLPLLGETIAIAGAYGLMVVMIFLYACFALGWHRSSLNGADPSNERNPFNLSGDDWKFIGLFMAVTLVFGLAMEALTYFLEHIIQPMGPSVQIAGSIGVMIVMGYFLYLFIRASFLFPAKSVGYALSWKDTKTASKGMYWPIIGSSIIFWLIFIVAFVVYLFVAGFITTIGAQDAEIGRTQGILMEFVLGMPVAIAALIVVALSISALSRAYQWGIQNNS